MAAPRRAHEDDKLKELILYVAMRTQDDPYCGAIKLNKILYHADFRAYLELGRSITGLPYMAQPFGPVPRRLVPARTSLVVAGDAEIVPERIGPRTQDRVFALREPKMSLFNDEEIELVDRVIEELRHVHWTRLSSEAHNTPGWKAAKFGADIPYSTAFVSTSAPEAELERARERARELAEVMKPGA